MPQTDYIAVSGPAFSAAELDALLSSALERAFSDLASGVPLPGPAQSRGAGSVLVLPPDLTRIHSGAGPLTAAVCRFLAACEGGSLPPGPEPSVPGAPPSAGLRPATPRRNWRLGAIMPALGTHRPLGPEEIAFMFPGCPPDKFLPHFWREDAVELGRLSAEWVEAAFTGRAASGGPEFSGGRVFRGGWPVQVNRVLRDGLPPDSGGPPAPFSLVISIGQVAPHEVAGMANHTKNIFVGTGGAEAINKSHYLGALYGLERIMGKAETPVRALFDEAFRRYGSLLPPVLWVLTVVDSAGTIRGLFSGFGRSCFEKASALSERVNISCLEEPAPKVVVWLNPVEYRSMWLGNKAVYRTRMAIAAGGELVVLAPGLECFGEDGENDALIRRYGYRGAEWIRRAVEADGAGLSSGANPPVSLSAAAHLIHGSSEGRFSIRYCTRPGRGPGRKEIEAAGYAWGNLDEAVARYVPELQNACSEQNANDSAAPKTGWKTSPGGEHFYFVANPALGLWRAAAGNDDHI